MQVASRCSGRESGGCLPLAAANGTHASSSARMEPSQCQAAVVVSLTLVAVVMWSTSIWTWLSPFAWPQLL
jgi:hypothetical protein